jgi:uncharacterized membrane protein (UPF0127 family)
MNAKHVVYPALAVVFLVFLVVLARYYSVQYTAQVPLADKDYSHAIELDGNTVRVAVADTPESRARGLGGRAGLAADEGMLFVFLADGKYAFWMKDMRFSLDILWLSSEGKVVSLVERVSPSTYPRDFVPDVPARYVLELPAGYVGVHAVRLGDTVRL